LRSASANENLGIQTSGESICYVSAKARKFRIRAGLNDVARQRIAFAL
jgi:hypothetical protein